MYDLYAKLDGASTEPPDREPGSLISEGAEGDSIAKVGMSAELGDGVGGAAEVGDERESRNVEATGIQAIAAE